MSRRIAVLALLAGCHVIARSETVRRSPSEQIAQRDHPIALRPSLALTDGGMLRFVEPLVCPSDDVSVPRTTIETRVRPNYATFTIGVIATAIGGVLLVDGLFARSPASSAATYGGAAGLAIGLPLAVGPWLGTSVAVVDGAPRDAEHQLGPNVPCGDRPLVAHAATLRAGSLEIRGAIDADGIFAISPFAWVDAYAPKAAAIGLTARVDSGPTVELVLEPAALAARAPAFLAHAGFDARIEPLEHVPGLAAGIVRASLTSVGEQPALRVVLPIANAGPGDAWAVRGELTAPGVPAIDGRIIYVGHVTAKASVTRELVIPLAVEAAAALRGSTLELAIELRDAHGTAPSIPATFRGALLVDAPRP